MSITTNYRQNGRDVANAEGTAFKRWLKCAQDIRTAGDKESDAYKAARGESAEGYVERGGSANTFKTKLSNCNVILDTFADRTIDELVKDHRNLNVAYRAAQTANAPKDAEGNPVVTTKGVAEYLGDVESVSRRAAGKNATLEEIIAAATRGFHAAKA